MKNIEQLRPYHPESSKADFVGYADIQNTVDSMVQQSPDKEYRSAEQTIDLTSKIQNVVRQSLRFDSEASISELARSQVTNCVGYTIVGSEALERAQIDHYVAFMNGHANLFVPVEIDDERRIWMIDMLSSDLNQDITDSFNLYRPSGDDIIDSDHRSFGTLYSNRLHIEDKAGSSLTDAQIHPWIVQKEYSERKVEPASNRRLIVTLSTPSHGRYDIQQYGSFMEGWDKSNLQQATEAILSLAGRFPDVDIRGASVKKVSSLVKHAALQGDCERAQLIADSFYDSFVGTDTRVYEGRADCMRDISKISGKPEFTKRAIELYENALLRRQAKKSSVIGKIAISQEFLQKHDNEL